MINRVLSSAKMPYENCKGTFIQRKLKSEKIMHDLIDGLINDCSDKKSRRFEEIQKRCGSLIGENINLLIRKKNIFDCPFFAPLIKDMQSNDDVIDSLAIFLPSPVLGKARCTKDNIVVLAHELLHAFDSLTNPKFSQNFAKICRIKNSDKIASVYEKHLYPKSKNFDKLPQIIEDTLKDYSAEDKIIILNYMRYSLMLEEHAISMDNFYQALFDAGCNSKAYGNRLSSLFTDLPESGFKCDFLVCILKLKEKITIINDLLAKTIKNERVKIAQSLEKNNSIQVLTEKYNKTG